MSESLANLKKKSSGKVVIELLNTPILLTTSDQTITFSHSVESYDFILAYTHQTNNFQYNGALSQSFLYTSVNLIYVPYYKNRETAFQQFIFTGSNGTLSSVKVNFTRMSETQVTCKLGGSRSNTYIYFYGFKCV